MRRRAGHGRCRGVTLLEIILATGLLVILMSLTMSFYFSTLGTRDSVLRDAQRLRLTRSILDRMAREIRQASVINADGRVGIRGTGDRIWLSTVRVPSREPMLFRKHPQDLQPWQYDLTKIEYKIVSHPEIKHPDGYSWPLGLARVELPIPRKDSAERAVEQEPAAVSEEAAATEEPVAPEEDLLSDEELAEQRESTLMEEIDWEELYSQEIRYLRFCYYDGYKWWSQWDVRGENPLPQIVQVTIGFAARAACGELTELVDEEERFCGCMNKEIERENLEECDPLPEDTFTILVRVPQADPFFRSRVARETVSFVEALNK